MGKKINILFVNHVSSLSGSSMSCYDLVKYLPSTDFNPIFAAGNDGSVQDLMKKAGVKTFTVNNSGIWGFNYIRKFLKIIKEEKVDIIHLTTLTSLCKYAGIAGFIKRVPIIWHIREGDLDKRRKKFIIWLKMIPAKILLQHNLARKILFPNISSKKIEIIYNAIDLVRFKPQKNNYLHNLLKLQQDILLVGSVGSISRRKGIEYLIKAIPIVKNRVEKFRVVIIGDDVREDERDLKRLKMLAENLGVKDFVFFLKGMEDIEKAINDICLLVLSSIEESFPRVLIEAFACAKPVVATRVGGIPEIVEDGVDGLLVSPGKEDEIAEAIVRLLENVEEREKIGKRGFEKASKQFSLEVYSKRIRNIYGEVLSL